MKLRPLSDGCPLIRAAMAFVVNDYAMQDVDVQPFPAAVGYVYYADGRTLHFSLCDRSTEPGSRQAAGPRERSE